MIPYDTIAPRCRGLLEELYRFSPKVGSGGDKVRTCARFPCYLFSKQAPLPFGYSSKLCAVGGFLWSLPPPAHVTVERTRSDWSLYKGSRIPRSR